MNVGEMLKEAAVKYASRINNENRGLYEWAMEYCPHFIFREPSERFHKPLCTTYDTIKDGQNVAIICPRGYAKSTWTQIFIMKCICEKLEPYILLIMDSSEQAEQSLGVIREELETNTKMKEDYGDSILKGGSWNNREIITSGGICVQALGRGKKVRGRRYKQHRPSLVILDDPDNDESVETPGQRSKAWNWFQKAVMKCGDTYTKFIIIGTVLHKECMVCRAENLPSFIAIRYRAIISWPTNFHLWEKWIDLYTNGEQIRVDGSVSRSSVQADEFYDTYKEEMDEGAAVLWEQKESLEDLMRQYAEDRVSFMSEKQNESFDPSKCEFDPEWLSEERSEIWYDSIEEFSRKGVVSVGYVDWAKGKETKRADYSAVIILHFDGYNAYIEADIQKNPVNLTCNNIIGWHKQVNFDAFGTETTGFQHLAAEDLADAAENENREDFLDILLMMDNQIKKSVRIARLSSWLQRGFFKFKRNCRFTEELISELLEYPNPNAHDDGPDALEGALRVLHRLVVDEDEEEGNEHIVGHVA